MTSDAPNICDRCGGYAFHGACSDCAPTICDDDTPGQRLGGLTVHLVVYPIYYLERRPLKWARRKSSAGVAA
jgi:hypothetical protein